jgi:hypothetical protein
MAPVAPRPIVVDEQEAGPGLGLRDASDLAPYLAQTDVWLTGHAVRHGHAGRDGGRPQTPGRFLEVRLALVRDGEAILDKSIELDPRAATPGRSGVAPQVPIPSMGPLSRSWPIRRQRLGTADPRRLEGAAIDVPESFDWTYFQAAPLDQRIGPLRGDEWLLLEGVHPTLPRIETQLPGARAVARLYGPFPAGFRPLPLVLDTVRVDADKRCCLLSWRGHFPVAGEETLASLHVMAGVELPGRTLVWRGSAASTEVEGDDLAGTLPIDGLTAADLLARPATPFRDGPATLSYAPAQPASPARQDELLGGTLPVEGLTAAELLARPVTPFHAEEPRAELPPAIFDPLGGTIGFDEATAAALASKPATPFREGVPALPPSRGFVSAPAAGDALGGTVGLSDEAIAELAARPATPFELPAWGARTSGGSMPSGLGDQFLFAMAALERHGDGVTPAKRS